VGRGGRGGRGWETPRFVEFHEKGGVFVLEVGNLKHGEKAPVNRQRREWIASRRASTQ
jgi:hypothetical protein